MADEGSSPIEKVFSFVMRLKVSLLLPGWGLAMIVLGLMWGMFWWIASGLVGIAIGIVFFAGSSLIALILAADVSPDTIAGGDLLLKRSDQGYNTNRLIVCAAPC